MVSVRHIKYRSYSVELGYPEIQMLERYASNQDVDIPGAIASLFGKSLEYAKTAMAEEESKVRVDVGDNVDHASLLVRWPLKGPLSILTEAEQRFVDRLIDLVMDMALHIIVKTKVQELKSNELGSEDEGNGTNVPTVP